MLRALVRSKVVDTEALCIKAGALVWQVCACERETQTDRQTETDRQRERERERDALRTKGGSTRVADALGPKHTLVA
jgi:hypothetical protein